VLIVVFDTWSDRCILSSPASLVDNEGEECLVQQVSSGNLDKTGNGKREMCFFPFSCITLHTAAAGRGSVLRVAPAAVMARSVCVRAVLGGYPRGGTESPSREPPPRILGVGEPRDGTESPSRRGLGDSRGGTESPPRPGTRGGGTARPGTLVVGRRARRGLSWWDGEPVEAWVVERRALRGPGILVVGRRARRGLGDSRGGTGSPRPGFGNPVV
jgi:hypothetical protein